MSHRIAVLRSTKLLLLASTLLIANSCGDRPTEPKAVRLGRNGVVNAQGDAVDLTVVATGPTTLKAGNALSFVVTVTNAGTSVTATSVQLTWTAGSTDFETPSCFLDRCAFGPMSPGQSKTVTFHGIANEAGVLTFAATASTSTAESDLSNNTATISTNVSPGADLAVEQTAPAQVQPGATFTHSITVRNNGAASAGATVEDVMPPLRSVEVQTATASTGQCAITVVTVEPATLVNRHKVTCELGPMAAGSIATVQIVAVYGDDSFLDVGAMTSTAKVEGADGDVNLANNEASVTTLFSPTDLQASLTGPTTALTALPITYVATMTNAGQNAARASFTIRFPSGIDPVSVTQSAGSCSTFRAVGLSISCGLIDKLEPGATVTVTMQMINSSQGGKTVEAEVRNDSHTESDPSNDVAELRTTVSTNPNPPTVDLAVTVTGPATVRAGTSLSYDVTVTNPSASVTAAGITLSYSGFPPADTPPIFDCFGGSCRLGALAPGQTKTIPFTGIANETGTVTFTATATTAMEADPTNNTASAVTEVTEGVDLVIVKTAPAQVPHGAIVSYDLTVRNDGGASAGVTVVDSMPIGRPALLVQSATPSVGSCTVTAVNFPGTSFQRDRVFCDLGPMAAGATATIHIEALFALDAGEFRSSNKARVVAADGDANLANNLSSASTIYGASDLQASLTGPATALTGQPITYIGTARNDGPDPASGELRISVPDGTDIVSFASTAGTCSLITPGTRDSAVCRGWTLAAGESVTMTFVAMTTHTGILAVEGSVRNDASFVDTNTENDEVTLGTTIKNPVPVVSLSGSASVQEGGVQTYNFGVTTASGSFTLASADCGSNATLVEGSLSTTATGGSFQCRFPDGPATSTVTVTARDETLNTTGSVTRQVTVGNVAPIATLALSATSVLEGSPFTIQLNDPQDVAADLSSLQFAFDCGAGYGSFGASATASCATVDEATVVARAKVQDKDGGITEYTRSVSVVNAAPVLGAINAPMDPKQIGAAFAASATYSDAGVQDTHSAHIDWGDGSSDQVAVSNGAISASHAYALPGVYRIRLTVSDNDGATSNESVFEYVVAYDPSGGFVTGGGWIWSPPGACELTGACAGLQGKASFGFVAKYLKGVPTGNTEFQFHAGGLKFKSTSYEWLVVNGHKAQFRGTGTIDGGGSYTFLLTAIDGDEIGGDGTDKLRLKIWNTASGALVYDNKKGSAESSADATALGGGSIVIHK